MNADQRSFVEQLLEQETPLTNEQYLAYRARVREGIRKAQKQERVVRITTQAGWGLFGVLMLCGMIVDFNREVFSEMVRLWLIAATAVCLACAVAFLAFYLINYRPRNKDAEKEILLLSLQRQLCELRGKLQQDTDRQSPESRNDAKPGG